MKRSLILILATILLLTVVGCGTDEKSSKVPPIKTVNQGEAQDYLSLAKEGRVTGIEFAIGSESKEIVSKLGQPQAQDYFNGSYYLSYEDIVFFTDGTNSTDGRVVTIAVSKGKEVYGVQIGQTPAEIKKKLGPPSSEGLADENDELNSGNWLTVYNEGKYKVIFVSAGQNSPTESMELVENK